MSTGMRSPARPFSREGGLPGVLRGVRRHRHCEQGARADHGKGHAYACGPAHAVSNLLNHHRCSISLFPGPAHPWSALRYVRHSTNAPACQSMQSLACFYCTDFRGAQLRALHTFAMKSGIFYTISAPYCLTLFTLHGTKRPSDPRDRGSSPDITQVQTYASCSNRGNAGSFGELVHRLKRAFAAKELRFADCGDQRRRCSWTGGIRSRGTTPPSR